MIELDSGMQYIKPDKSRVWQMKTPVRVKLGWVWSANSAVTSGIGKGGVHCRITLFILYLYSRLVNLIRGWAATKDGIWYLSLEEKAVDRDHGLEHCITNAVKAANLMGSYFCDSTGKSRQSGGLLQNVFWVNGYVNSLIIPALPLSTSGCPAWRLALWG